MSEQYPTQQEYQEQLDAIFAQDPDLYNYIMYAEYEEMAEYDLDVQEERCYLMEDAMSYETIRWAALTPEQHNRLVAEKVFELPLSQVKERWTIPHYSEDIMAAWLVFEYLRQKKGFDIHFASTQLQYDVAIIDRKRPGRQWFEASAPSLPEALCIAALRACCVLVDTSSPPPTLRRHQLNSNVNPPGGSTTGWIDISQLSAHPPVLKDENNG